MSADAQPTTRREALIAVLLAVALIALALAVRLPNLDRFVTPDEMKWVCRSTNFYRGLRTGHLEETLQTGHPGVLTMWLGTPFAGHDATDPAWEITREISLADLIANNPPGTAAKLAVLLFKARRAVAILTALAIGCAALLLWRLLDLPTASIAGLLMALDPFLIAHSRFLHLDAVMSSMLLLSILTLLLALEREKRGLLVLSGVLGALAALNKSPALFVGPFAALLMLGYVVWRKQSWKRLIATALIWGLPLLATYALVWPAMWAAPLQALELVFGTAFFYASNPHTNSNFFLGSPRPDPGPLFYPVALAFRLTPWSLLGGALALPWLFARERRGRLLRLLALFVLLFGLFMTVGQKKFDRYLLPVFPFVEIIAALGFVAGGRWLLERLRAARLVRWLAPALGLVILALSAWIVLPHRPYYLTYYNPLLGGGEAAVETLLVGWGEGLDQAGRYVDALPDAEDLVMSARSLPGSASFFRGIARDEEHYDAATTDYVIIYLNEVQRRLGPETLERYYDVAEPVYVARLQGIEYAWVYENRTHEPVVAAIEAAAAEGDAVIVSRASRFAELYDGPLPVYVVDPAAPRDSTLAALDALAAGHQRLWFVRYDERNPNPELDWLDHLLRTRTFGLEEQQFTDVSLSLWRCADAPGFGAQDTAAEAVDLRYGEALRLRGVRLDTAQAQYGRALGLDLEWEALGDLTQYYAEYVHLVDESGRRWGQGDRWMTDESLRPTVTWKSGQQVSDHLAIELVPGTPPGAYRLLLGVYDRVEGDRLTARDGDGSELGERCEIGRVWVAPSPLKAQESDLLIANRLDREVAPGLTLLGWELQPAEPAFGQQAAVLLYWRGDDTPAGDWLATVRLVDDAGTPWATAQAAVGSADYQTSAWEAGEVLWQAIDITVSSEAPAGTMTLELSLSAGEAAGTPITLGRPQVAGHYWSAPDIAHQQTARLGESIRLLGYDLAPLEPKPGDVVQLTLYWAADAKLERGLTVFTHLLDGDGVVRGQRDSVPLDGRYPVTAWRSDETIVDRYEIALDADAPAGSYQVEIGMYDPADNASRLPLFDASGARQQDDRLLLDTPLEVAP